MSYPQPIEFESASSLYKQAMFFYKEYERMKKKAEKLEQKLNSVKPPEKEDRFY